MNFELFIIPDNRRVLFVKVMSVLILLSILGSCSNLDKELEHTLSVAANGMGKEYFILPQSENYDSIPQDAKNPITKEKVELGKLLFHEPAMATRPYMPEGRHTYSCASCHKAEAGFQAGIRQGKGDGGLGNERKVNSNYSPIDSIDLQLLRSTSIMNTPYQRVMTYNGRFGSSSSNEGTNNQWNFRFIDDNYLGYEGVETQAIAGLHIHRLDVDDYLLSLPGYKKMFDKAFPESSEDNRYSRINAGLAIAAYERTVLANKSPFQQWLRGHDKTMTNSEKKGAILFFGKAGCVECHTGPALNTEAFYALGMQDMVPGTKGVDGHTEGVMVPEIANGGRGMFTKVYEDYYKFKVPQLYNLADSKFYGHGGSFNSIQEVIEYKNKAESGNDRVDKSRLPKSFVPLGLDEKEIEQIALFIEKSLRDPDLKRYVPETIPSELMFPNNDPVTRKELTSINDKLKNSL